jgi:DNA-binding MarR family transcriptional regulator
MTPIEDPPQLRWTDEAILEELREQRLEYVALLANRRGLHLDYARERCQRLAERGLVERTTDEVTYRITAAGERYLDTVADDATRATRGERAAGPATGVRSTTAAGRSP